MRDEEEKEMKGGSELKLKTPDSWLLNSGFLLLTENAKISRERGWSWLAGSPLFFADSPR